MFFKHNLPALSWALLILILTLMPGYAMPDTPDWDFLKFDTLAHFFVFGVQTFLFIIGFKKQDDFFWLRSYPVLSAILIGIIYGIAIEVAQGFIPERYFDYVDMIANSIGCLTGWAAYQIINKF